MNLSKIISAMLIPACLSGCLLIVYSPKEEKPKVTTCRCGNLKGCSCVGAGCVAPVSSKEIPASQPCKDGKCK